MYGPAGNGLVTLQIPIHMTPVWINFLQLYFLQIASQANDYRGLPFPINTAEYTRTMWVKLLAQGNNNSTC